MMEKKVRDIIPNKITLITVNLSFVSKMQKINNGREQRTKERNQEITNERDRVWGERDGERRKTKIWHTNWVYTKYVCIVRKNSCAHHRALILFPLPSLSCCCCFSSFACSFVFSYMFYSAPISLWNCFYFTAKKKNNQKKKKKKTDTHTHNFVCVHLPASNIFCITVTMSRHSLK